MPPKPVIEHLIRRATVPWRAVEDHLTECGKNAADFPSITYDQFARKLRQQGQQRAAMSTCMTCWNAADRWKTWAVDPVDAVRREVLGLRDNVELFRRELWAIAALVQAHRDEFDGYLTGLNETTDLASRRRAKRLTGR